MTDFVAIIGSLRAASVNRVCFTTAQGLLPDGVTLTEAAVNDVPLFNGDIEDAGDPPAVADLKQAVGAAEGLVIFTPEYNFGVPAITKNAIDWLSRPFGSGVIADKPVGVVAISPGRRAGAGVRNHLSDSLRVLTPRFFETTLGIGSVFDHLSDGGLSGEPVAELEAWLLLFVDHAGASDSKA